MAITSNQTRLINNREHRLVQFLVQLNKQNTMPITDLMTYLNCSKSTILNDIDYFNNHFSKSITLSVNKKQHVILNCGTSGNINQVIREISLSSPGVQLVKKLFAYPNQSIFFYAQKLFTSPATLYRTIKKFTPILKEAGLVIQNKQKKYRLISDSDIELYIFLTKGLEELYALSLPEFTSAKDYEAFYQLYPFHLEEEQHFLFLLKEVMSFHPANRKANLFDDFFHIYKEIPMPNNLITVMTRFIQQTQMFLDIDFNQLDDIERLFIFVKKREILFSNHEPIFFNRHETFVSELAEQRPFLFKQLKTELMTAMKELQMSPDYSFDYLCYLILITFPLTQPKVNQRNIYLYSDLGKRHGNFLAQALVTKFNVALTNITLVTFEFFDTYVYKKGDMVISTVQLSDDIPCMLINDFPLGGNSDIINNNT